MKLAFSTLGCPDWTLERALQAATEWGYQGIELRLLDREMLSADLPPHRRQDVKARCRAHGIAIACVDTSLRLAATEKGERAQTVAEGLAFLDLAADLGSPLLRVFGMPSEGVSASAALSAGQETLEPLARRGAELGVRIVLETHDAFCRGEQVRQVLAHASPAGAGALWDVMHPCRVGEALQTTLAAIGDRLLHVHVKDGAPIEAGSTTWRQTLLGLGVIPLREIVSALRERSYEGWLSVEWEKKWHPDLEEPEVALPQHADKLREYLAAANVGS
jgi:sugar phosphate isomerase/epimerase